MSIANDVDEKSAEKCNVVNCTRFLIWHHHHHLRFYRARIPPAMMMSVKQTSSSPTWDCPPTLDAAVFVECNSISFVIESLMRRRWTRFPGPYFQNSKTDILGAFLLTGLILGNRAIISEAVGKPIEGHFSAKSSQIKSISWLWKFSTWLLILRRPKVMAAANRGAPQPQLHYQCILPPKTKRRITQLFCCKKHK